MLELDVSCMIVIREMQEAVSPFKSSCNDFCVPAVVINHGDEEQLQTKAPAVSVVFGRRHRKRLKRTLAGSCIMMMIVDHYEKRLRSMPSTPS